MVESHRTQVNFIPAGERIKLHLLVFLRVTFNPNGVHSAGLDLEYEVLNVWHVEPGAASHHPDILTRLKYLLVFDFRRHTVQYSNFGSSSILCIIIISHVSYAQLLITHC